MSKPRFVRCELAPTDMDTIEEAAVERFPGAYTNTARRRLCEQILADWAAARRDAVRYWYAGEEVAQ